MLRNKAILRALLLLFLVRLALALLPSFEVDMGAWLAWAHRLRELPLEEFYSETVWTQYTPGYLYWLLIVGKLGWVDPLMIKIPVIIFDIATAYLITKIVKPKTISLAYWIYGIYVLNPVVIFDGSVWGQIDGILSFAMLAATYYLIERRQVLASYALSAGALLIKPQAIAIVPALLFYTAYFYGWRKLAPGVMLMGLITVLGFWPFYPANPVAGMLELITKMSASYPYTSLFAYNVWSYVGMWQVDATTYGGLSYARWGVGLVGVAFVLMAAAYYRLRRERKYAYLVMALSCLIFYLFPTRVHERYLFPFFAFFTTTVLLLKNRLLTMVLIIMSVLYTLNLYVPYSHYAPLSNSLKNPVIEGWITELQPVIATSYVVVYILLLTSGLFPGGKKSKERLPVRAGERKPKEQRRNKD